MRRWLAMVALLSGCLAESAQGPGARMATPIAADATCNDEKPTGSQISRMVCRPQPTETEDMAATTWRNRYPFNPSGAGSQHTDTPLLRVYR